MDDGAIPQELKLLLTKQHYRMVGRHSAVKVCEWLRKSLLNKGVCYKQQFYGINSHRCLQMTPAVAHCTHKCVFCWRPIEWTLGTELKEWDDPEYIVEESIKAQRILISGFGGNLDNINKKRWEEAQNPNQAAISLAGEPTIYPRIGELIGEFKERGFTTFLVTNGTLPERLENMETLPTQLYLSLDAPNEELYKKVDVPIIKGGWEKINKTLELFPNLDCKKAIRITLIKSINDHSIEQYVDLIRKAEPDYIECKSYMCIGYSRKRLTLDNMMSSEEIADFSQKLADDLGYKVKDSKSDSRVTLLSKNG